MDQLTFTADDQVSDADDCDCADLGGLCARCAVVADPNQPGHFCDGPHCAECGRCILDGGTTHPECFELTVCLACADQLTVDQIPA